MIDVILDTLLDAVKILPFLFLTYWIMEYIEHKTSKKVENFISRSGKFGPLFGGILGAFPQCGFSAAASNLYAGRVITLGTLLAIYLSTSDEMLPILISEQVEISLILKIVGMKLVIGVIAGFLIDFFVRKQHPGEKKELRIEHMCEHEHCNCEHESPFKSAIKHTLHIMIYILIITFVLNGVIALIGEENLAGLILNTKFLGPIIAGVVGLIPNCAASVILTQLYIEGVLGLGAMMAGLLVGAGVGLLILFRANDNAKENLKIVSLLYVIGVFSGIIIEIAGISF